MLTRRLLLLGEGGSASAAAAARLVQSRHAPSCHPPRPGPRLTAPPSHLHHPALPPLSLPITPRQPRVPSPTSPRPPFPGRGSLSPLRPAPFLSAATVGSPNVSNQQNRLRDSPLRHCRASNRGAVPARSRKAPPHPIVSANFLSFVWQCLPRATKL